MKTVTDEFTGHKSGHVSQAKDSDTVSCQISRFTGLVAAPFTPFLGDGSLNLDVIPEYARFLKQRGVSAAFICGTTGECTSLSISEREAVAEAWLHEPVLPVIVHTGHTTLRDARRLAVHAQECGAVAVAAFAPFFFKPRNPVEMVEWCAAIAEVVPELPFYYYHIPSMTGADMPVAEILECAESRIPNLAGVKYTYEDIDDFETCLRYRDHRFDLLFGRDELLMEGWQHGARGAVGSTYNYASPLYLRILKALENGHPDEARALQDLAISMIDICNSAGVTHLAASKALMGMLGVECGPVRLPLANPTPRQLSAMRDKLEALGFFAPDFGGVVKKTSGAGNITK
ncbi:MAG: dihydrodipicolinate synthase family protein [Verrucomicrobiota bacterium JB024]|nr:dihydrodipicolinate synthase family protein [Verrucomicrobiota bacterium JB024]